MEEPDKKNPENLLTGIRDAYTLAATDERSSEVDGLMVKNFLNALAEIALAVASRKAAR